MYREHTKEVRIGNRVIGGGNPILNSVYDKHKDRRCGSNSGTDFGVRSRQVAILSVLQYLL